MMGIMTQMMQKSRTEVTEKLRSEVNKIVKTFIDQGKAEIVPGVVFIDEVSI